MRFLSAFYTIGDEALLADVQASLTDRPFAPQVRVAGTLVPRALARQIERNLLRLKSLTRSPAPATQAPFLAGATSCARPALEGAEPGVSLGRGVVGSFHAEGVACD